MPSNAAEKAKAAKRASRIRTKLTRGKEITAEERHYLARYDATVKPTKPRRVQPMPPPAATDPGAPPVVWEAPPKREADPAPPPPPPAPPAEPPPPTGPPPAPEGAPFEDAPDTEPEADAATAAPTEEPATGGVIELEVAEMVTEWARASNAEIRAAGWLTVPDAYLDKLFLPAMKRMEAKANAAIAEKVASQEELDAAVVAAPVLEIAIFRFLKWRKSTKEAEQQQPAQQPRQPRAPDAPTQPPPAERPQAEPPPARVAGRPYVLS
jgi:hypothetical protein